MFLIVFITFKEGAKPFCIPLGQIFITDSCQHLIDRCVILLVFIVFISGMLPYFTLQFFNVVMSADACIQILEM